MNFRARSWTSPTSQPEAYRAAQLQKEIELAKAGIVDRFKKHRKRPLAGQEAKAVAGLPDLSLSSSEKQIATGTDDKSAGTADGGSPRSILWLF
ncbi:MAG: hypothetical protein ACYTFW_25210 [Planctomycetota bacterium]|jgi:hypothetical protein